MGWYVGTTKITSSTTITGTTTITAKFSRTANKYAVTLNFNGGSGGSTSVTATYNSAMPSATMPSRNGYTFAGYYDTSSTSGGTQYYTASGTSARSWNKTAATTLYARWTPKTIKITLNANGGSGGTSAIWFKYGTATYYSNSSCTSVITSITKPTRAGYTFNTSKGFYSASAKDGATTGERYIAYDSVTFASDLCTDFWSDSTLICEWTVEMCTVYFDTYTMASWTESELKVMSGSTYTAMMGLGRTDAYVEIETPDGKSYSVYIQVPNGLQLSKIDTPDGSISNDAETITGTITGYVTFIAYS